MPSLERPASFTRPADTTPYAAGDLVANNTTAGSVAQLNWSVSGAGFWLRQVRFRKSKVDASRASFRLWLHGDSAVTFSNGDNGALSIASSSLAIGDVACAIDLPASTMATLTGAGTIAIATFDPGLIFLPAITYGFLEARDAYTPASGEVFSISLRGDPYP